MSVKFLNLPEVGVIHADGLIRIEDHSDEPEPYLSCSFDQDNEFEIEDAQTIAYVLAYATEQQFFKLDNVWYNPTAVHAVNLDVPEEAAYITDKNGDIWEHNGMANLGALQAAAAVFVWLPSVPA